MKRVFKSGNEAAAYAAKQINYHIMGYYPITPSTQVAENIDLMVSEGESNTVLIAAEGEHSAAGICYGASAGGGRVINATSANGLLYALEQLPVQSGTRLPMVMNVACRTVSGPLSIKGDHSDIMYALNCGWIILFANNAMEVYDFNIIAPRLGESVRLPVIVAYDGFFTSHQKRVIDVLEDDKVKAFVGEIWVDLELGTNIRNLIKSGIDNITVAEIRTELETKLDKYFHNDLTIETLDIWQELDKLKINLEYIELRTGTHYTVQSEETIINKDQTLYYNNETM